MVEKFEPGEIYSHPILGMIQIIEISNSLFMEDITWYIKAKILYSSIDAEEIRMHTTHTNRLNDERGNSIAITELIKL
jgi:hypothetical protein